MRFNSPNPSLITMEYYKLSDDNYHVYTNVINTQTNQPLTTTELENILKIYNIKIDRNGGYYIVRTTGWKLDVDNTGSITLKKCNNNCISGFFLYVDYIEPSTPSTPSPPKNNVILSVHIAPYLIPTIPTPRDPTKINSIKFVAN